MNATHKGSAPVTSFRATIDVEGDYFVPGSTKHGLDQSLIRPHQRRKGGQIEDTRIDSASKETRINSASIAVAPKNTNTQSILYTELAEPTYADVPLSYLAKSAPFAQNGTAAASASPGYYSTDEDVISALMQQAPDLSGGPKKRFFSWDV